MRKELIRLRSFCSWLTYLQMHSPLHPLRLVGRTKINAPKQDRLVKVHINIVPEWPKRVPVLERMGTSVNGRKARLDGCKDGEGLLQGGLTFIGQLFLSAVRCAAASKQ